MIQFTSVLCGISIVLCRLSLLGGIFVEMEKETKFDRLCLSVYHVVLEQFQDLSVI